MSTNMGEVVTLQGGSATDWRERPDWTPIAQPPGADDVIAHTPNPAAYHEVEGRVMIPRAKPGKGNFASQGFSTKPGVLHIDPSNPVTGEGGLTVDLEGFNARDMAKATQAGQGDPMRAWMAAVQLKQGSAAPQPQPQVTVQQATPVAAQAPTDPSRQMTPSGPPLVSPSVKQTTQGRPMSIPQQVPVETPPPAAAYPQPPQPQPQPQQAPAQPQYQPPPQQYQQPYYPPPQPPQPDPMQQATLQMLQGMMGTLKDMQASMAELRNPPDPAVQVKEAAKQMSMSPRHTEKSVEREPEYEGAPELSVPEDTGLEFLTTPPSPPKMQVVFDLGRGGKHFKRFHYIAIHGKCLSMLFDSRYEGDQFIPPSTEEGDPPIEITFPQHKNKTVKALVPKDFNQRLGCLDQLNFIIVEDEQVGPASHNELAESLQQ